MLQKYWFFNKKDEKKLKKVEFLSIILITSSWGKTPARSCNSMSVPGHFRWQKHVFNEFCVGKVHTFCTQCRSPITTFWKSFSETKRYFLAVSMIQELPKRCRFCGFWTAKSGSEVFQKWHEMCPKVRSKKQDWFFHISRQNHVEFWTGFEPKITKMTSLELIFWWHHVRKKSVFVAQRTHFETQNSTFWDLENPIFPCEIVFVSKSKLNLKSFLIFFMFYKLFLKIV